MEVLLLKEAILHPSTGWTYRGGEPQYILKSHFLDLSQLLYILYNVYFIHFLTVYIVTYILNQKVWTPQKRFCYFSEIVFRQVEKTSDKQLTSLVLLWNRVRFVVCIRHIYTQMLWSTITKIHIFSQYVINCKCMGLFCNKINLKAFPNENFRVLQIAKMFLNIYNQTIRISLGNTCITLRPWCELLNLLSELLYLDIYTNNDIYRFCRGANQLIGFQFTCSEGQQLTPTRLVITIIVIILLAFTGQNCSIFL